MLIINFSEQGPQQPESSSLGIIGPVHSPSVRLLMAPGFCHIKLKCQQCLSIMSVVPRSALFTLIPIFAVISVQLYLFCVLRVTPCLILCNSLSRLFGQIDLFSSSTVLCQPVFLHHRMTFAVCLHPSSSLFPLLPFLGTSCVSAQFFWGCELFSLDLKLLPLVRGFLFSFLSCCTVWHTSDTQV